MTKKTLSLVIGGGVVLLLVPAAIAFACSCPAYESEARVFRVSSITRIAGEGAVPDGESTRWAGELTLTSNGPMDDSLRLYLRNEVSDEQVRNVWIDAVQQASPADTGPEDTGGAR